ncbi:MAG TPA: S8 family serine peptidase [Accumulibacter sp.]|uniref:S8 family serine peptidase n=1 Tax=Accumulibacter sp. TaxID=2053492 RepID=UPI00287A95ED|nr:S8 family serine peptidase [Accumulibacter sp.]MDS4055698.1 S8 family serine peptidase [Accumulibacter sp.]HMV05520.1 S8 family serine peptidase [Accumulibacter sp.]HNC27703.1 S8 family serine peptidase [Accumulibacter sp.]HND39837.1 S8 family serine peptidase [Accumulibacter sp.]HNG88101.1 S8 family serine peptidase [Accumulibacter sp.]
MTDHPTFSASATREPERTSGRFVVTFRDDDVAKGVATLAKRAAIRSLPSAADFTDSALDMAQLSAAGGAVFPTLGVAVVTLDDDALSSLMAAHSDDADGAILDIEPERTFYALGDDAGLSLAYLQGYRDAADNLYERARASVDAAAAAAASGFFDDAQSTWGLKATRAVNSQRTGSAIKLAVLDTGFDLQHPDFRGRRIVTASFVSGQTVQDGHGHGTHCIGTSCGSTDGSGRRYGVAQKATIHAGKVLADNGSGSTSGILAGMEWAINSGCQVISMSLGNTVSTPSTAYEKIGQRALQKKCLIIAAAGNHRPGTVGQPANSPSILAVGAVDSQMRLASFSCGSGSAGGANVDLVGPGVAVYSSTKLPTRYASWNGTSMATPHVAGVAALWAQTSAANRGAALWQLLTARALRLPLAARDVGVGLVQSPPT